MVFTVIIIITGCKKSNIDKNIEYNGIDPQILRIIDTIPRCMEDEKFITVIFSPCDKNTYIIKFYEGVLIPVKRLSDQNIERNGLISESDGFRGYKKYKNIYIIFEDWHSCEYFEKFVNRDSLSYDETIFQYFNVYERSYDGIRDCDPPLKYLINKNDSLVLYNKKCLFDY